MITRPTDILIRVFFASFALLVARSPTLATEEDVTIDSPSDNAVIEMCQTNFPISGTYKSAGLNRIIIVNLWEYDPVTNQKLEHKGIKTFGPVGSGTGSYSVTYENLALGHYKVEVDLFELLNPQTFELRHIHGPVSKVFSLVGCDDSGGGEDDG